MHGWMHGWMHGHMDGWPFSDVWIDYWNTGLTTGVRLTGKVYDLLERQGVPHPENVYASRDGYVNVPAVAVPGAVDVTLLSFLLSLPLSLMSHHPQSRSN